MLVRTNIFLFLLFLIGFFLVYAANFHFNIRALKKDIEDVSTLTNEGISYWMDSFVAQPVWASHAMANDALLASLLSEEPAQQEEDAYAEKLAAHLKTYQEKYGYPCVFVVSAQTGRYYPHSGPSRVLSPDDGHSGWYYGLLRSGEAYAVNVFTCSLSGDAPTVLVSRKIVDTSGEVIGVAGVTLRTEYMQKLLEGYDERFGTHSYLLDERGAIQFSQCVQGSQPSHFWDDLGYAEHKERILSEKTLPLSFWTRSAQRQSDVFVVSRYIPSLTWHLLVETSTQAIERQFLLQFYLGLFVSLVMIAVVLLIVNRLILRYNEWLVRLTVSQELEYQQLLHKATEGLYESVFEFDITHNRAGGDSTKQFFESLGLHADTPYEEALKAIAQKQVKEEFRQGYQDIFSVDNVLKSYRNGLSELYYDLQVTMDGTNYYWLRIRARIFYWASDRSVRMITYRQNIDEEKKREERMLQLARLDSLTGLYNKASTEKSINDLLSRPSQPDAIHAFLMIDIDAFKEVNDSFGHAAGDEVIKELGNTLKSSFRTTDICGRIGGDEFVVFLQSIPSREWLEGQARELIGRLRKDVYADGETRAISVSIGIALYPEEGEDFAALYKKADEALYLSKKQGKNRYSLFGK